MPCSAGPPQAQFPRLPPKVARVAEGRPAKRKRRKGPGGGAEGNATTRNQKRQQTRPPVQTHQEEREGRGALGGAGGGNRRPCGQQGKGALRRNQDLRLVAVAYLAS